MAEETPKANAQLDAEIGGQKFKFNGPLSTLITVLSFVITCLIAWVLWTHSGDTREAATALVGALREQTQVVRESNCLQSYRGPDDQKSAFCKQVAR